MAEVQCVDCKAEGITSPRKIAKLRNGKDAPGRRCATHHRARRTATRDTSWERRLIATYGITAEEYEALYQFQKKRNQALGLPGVCYICGRGTGTGKKRLSVDHCHKTGRVRGLLDTGCNKWVLGMLRDDPEALHRAIEYLTNPPAFSVIGERIAPIEIATLTTYGEVT